MKVYCVFSLESPQRGDSNEYTQYTISQYKKKVILNYPVLHFPQQTADKSDKYTYQVHIISSSI